jgi:hypothetical protein
MEAKRFLMIIIDYKSTTQLTDATEMAKNLLEKYANAKSFEIKNVT